MKDREIDAFIAEKMFGKTGIRMLHCYHPPDSCGLETFDPDKHDMSYFGDEIHPCYIQCPEDIGIECEGERCI